MARALSAKQNVIVNAVWAAGFVLGILVLGRTVGWTIDDQPVLYGLLLLGPVLSAAFCGRLYAVLLGALGFGAGILLAGVLAATLMNMSADWGRAIVLVLLISIADLIVTVPVWWCIRRIRRTTGVTTSAA
jgi:hypothetical protein